MLTIIIPTINRPSLDQAIESVLNQAGEKPDIIVVGDGVVPDTKYAREIFGVIAPKTGKAAVARNIGAQHAKEGWIGFLDDDDVLAPKYASWLKKVNSAYDVAIFNMDAGEKILPVDERIEWGNIGINFAVRSEIFRRYPFPEMQNGYEEVALLDRLAKAGCLFRFLPYTGYIVRPHEIKRKGDKQWTTNSKPNTTKA